MRAPLTLEQTKSVVAKATAVPIDPGLLEMIPQELLNYIQSAPDVAGQLVSLENRIAETSNQFTELNLALVEYANQSGQGQMMFDNLKLCLDQVRIKKQQGG